MIMATASSPTLPQTSWGRGLFNLLLPRLSRGRAGAGALLALLLIVVMAIPAMAGDVGPVIPKASGQCVEEPKAMRTHHFEFLKHQRDETLRAGVRGAKHSLKDCVACHATTGKDGKAVPVNAEGQFCASCHSYAAVAIDCFQCHATVPGATSGAKSAAR